jgi:hypothetical protein
VTEWLRQLAQELTVLDGVTVEPFRFPEDDEGILRSIYATKPSQACAAEIEVWHEHVAGWHLTLSNAYSEELAPGGESQEEVEALIKLTISGGWAIVRSRAKMFFAAAPNSASSRRRIRDGDFVIVREWCPWLPPDTEVEAEAIDVLSRDHWLPVKHAAQP